MAVKKTSEKKKGNASAGKSGKSAAQRKETQPEKKKPGTLDHVMPWILALVAVFILLCYVTPSLTGVVGGFIKNTLLGVFAGAAFVIPAILVVIALFWKKDAETRYIKFRIIFAVFSLISLSVILHGAGGMIGEFDIAVFYRDGTEIKGGGVVGGVLGSALHACIGYAGLYIVSVSLFVIMTIFLVGLTPRTIGVYISYYFHEHKEKARIKREERAKIYTDKPEPYVPEEYRTDPRNGSIDMDEDEPPFDTDEGEEEPMTFEDVLAENNTYEPAREEPVGFESIAPVNTELGKKRFPDAEGEASLEAIFGTDLDVENRRFVPTDDALASDGETEAELVIERSKLNVGELFVDPAEVKREKPKKQHAKYIFPPITLLESDSKEAIDKDEIEQKAVKLIETLASFRVKAKIIDIAHGPSITRYELVPEEGVRVRAIANLVDDIGLALATSGVRIEAPIPGKAAVGIEVPNKDRLTVHLRNLIENKEFRQNPSRVNVALGRDVAGVPIYLDIAKMPHLLIAGTTGSGKSVCISSMIISILYKASPDEVKMIIIDPKKIDFAFYNGLPHLLVPVVNDPKKAAGSLQWAVNEMERRYGLIESAGVRDIYNYNLVTKDDPTFEFLPQILIIIDEFADLMQTAPDAVEDCVCRLAQKARAAGMHLVIGTQRPSVDVITGLIKSNFPSRIALTVKSQVDSRTMIDMAGAEKLIGRGDMLFAPVGSFKPIRVQGAYLTDQEIEAVTGFIKAKTGESEYDDEVMDEIEREAAKCGVKKTGAASQLEDDDGETDPMLKSAIELAVDSGKISTSLIQRKLSLGYGRAAKLIDKMEQMGVVGAPDGNKPRQVMMTRQEYMEMVLNNPDM